MRRYLSGRRLRLRWFVFFVVAFMLIAFSAGCVKTTITESDVDSKQKQILDATEELMGGEIPASEQRG